MSIQRARIHTFSHSLAYTQTAQAHTRTHLHSHTLAQSHSFKWARYTNARMRNQIRRCKHSQLVEYNGIVVLLLLPHYAEVNIPFCIFPVPFPDIGCIQCMRVVCVQLVFINLWKENARPKGTTTTATK